MFKSVRVKNFRAITDLTVNGLSRVNLFVGHNASGKTTLLESLSFLIGATNPKLLVSANSFRGLPEVSRAFWPTYFRNMDVGIPIEIRADDAEMGEEQWLLIRPRYEQFGPDQEIPSLGVSTSWTSADSQSDGNINGLELEYSTSVTPKKEVSRVYLKDGRLVDEGAKPHLPGGTFVIPSPKDLRDRFSEVQRKKQVYSK